MAPALKDSPGYGRGGSEWVRRFWQQNTTGRLSHYGYFSSYISRYFLSTSSVVTCVYIIVVFRSTCPAKYCNLAISIPLRQEFVMKKWRKEWQDTFLSTPASRAYFFGKR